jgi:hypothetical protein
MTSSFGNPPKKYFEGENIKFEGENIKRDKALCKYNH